MSHDVLFRECVERLLKGGSICPFATPDLYNYLKRADLYRQVEDYIAVIDRALVWTNDRSAIYAVYRDVSDSSTRAIVRNHFERLSRDWEALLRWLRLVRHAGDTGRPLCAGDTLKESDLLAAIESSSNLQEDLESVAMGLGLKGKSSDPRQRLGALLDRLEKEGYLQKIGQSGMIYQATGRWSILYDQLEFIAQQEGILSAALEDEQNASPQQGGLLHGAP